MNRFLCVLVIFYSILFSGLSFASDIDFPPGDFLCDTNGSKDFVVQFQVQGSQKNPVDPLQALIAKGTGNGQDDEDVLWYNYEDSGDTGTREHYFKELDLETGVWYTIRIEVEHQQGNQPSKLYYYWVVNGVKVPPHDLPTAPQKEGEITNGQIGFWGSEVINLECGEDVPLPLPPPEIPDLCEVFPDVVQSWDGASSLQITNGGSKIYGTANDLGKVGFGSVSDQGEWQQACDDLKCIADSTLLIPEPIDMPFSSGDYKDFDEAQPQIPEGKYREINLSGGDDIYELIDGYYEIETLTLTGGAQLKVGSDTFIKVNRFEIDGGASITSPSGGAAEGLILWGEPLEQDQAPSITVSVETLQADIFSRGSVTLAQGAEHTGSVTAHDVYMGGDWLRRVADNCGGTTPGNYTLELFPLNGISLTCEDQHLTFQVKKNGSNATDYPGTIEVTNTAGELQPGGGSYTPDNTGELNLSLGQREVSTVTVTGCLSTNCSGTSVTGNYEFVPQKFAMESPKGVIAGKPTSIDIFPIQCNEQGQPVGIPSDEYSGDKTLILSDTTYVEPSTDRNASEVISIKDKDGNWIDAPNSQLQLTFTGGSDSESAKATAEVRYSEAGSVSYTMKDEVCITNDDGDEECKEIIGEQSIQSRPWTFAVCEPKGNDISGTSESGSFFKRSGEVFQLNAVPIRWVNDGDIEPTIPIEVSTFCNQLDSLETKNFYPDLAPAVNVSLEAELHSPHVDLGSEDTGTIGSNIEGVPVDGIPNNTNTSGPVTFSSLKWREAGSISVIASLKDQADYLFEPINPGYRSVGRFSPNHIAMLDEVDDPGDVWIQWEYADGHSDFAYMSQEITHRFKVQAQATDDTPTENYGLFNDDLISEIGYMAQTQGESPEIDFVDSSRIKGTSIWTGDAWPKIRANASTLFVEMTNFSLLRKVGTTATYTLPDGPYDNDNAVFGLKTTQIVDGVDIESLDIPDLGNSEVNIGQTLPNQPEFRYGRMNLDDVGGNTGQELRVPLRVEYWNGETFVINTNDDQGSAFNAANRQCIQVIWSNAADGSASSNLVSDGEQKVSQGSSEELHAQHSSGSASNNERAQVRLWLRQGDTSPQMNEAGIVCTADSGLLVDQPWLQYNWRDQGDEDPSTVVTFGTFRGNDRIIFKGESELFAN
ncbi:hypothetical protein VIN01S_32900 [Vibrio inusitatus NBRC 102082]|uniref:DUF6701 domain-containing protein n=1 Tax=Vibrio inusitatus NBRC 102082 TaxID=1219070 RepID=A0A4Y3HZA9_9VIBR|nr:DUF6701 domain-containing protein [Vibrio inusitatus]GEA52486.1 hypothetical protein VIN01S_32900 [Vibrio inusitatus NBRC 102082]